MKHDFHVYRFLNFINIIDISVKTILILPVWGCGKENLTKYTQTRLIYFLTLIMIGGSEGSKTKQNCVLRKVNINVTVRNLIITI